jgi:hypothetical protein
VLSITKTKLKGKSKKTFLKYATILKKELNLHKTKNDNYVKLINFKELYKIN